MWCQFIKLTDMFKKIYYSTILLADNHPTWIEKIQYLIKLLMAFAPVAYALDGLNYWFENNKQFVSFMIFCLIVNLVVGIWYHRKMKSFDWEEFLKKNSQMMTVVVVVYALLEMLHLTAGANFVGESFRVLIQITTLLYPISKALKNIYILSNKQFPPAFIMEKIYNFEKDGNLKDLFSNDESKNQE
jgi:hypothetical protein